MIFSKAVTSSHLLTNEKRLTYRILLQRYVVGEARSGRRGGVRAGRALSAADVRDASVVLTKVDINLFIKLGRSCDQGCAPRVHIA